MATYTKVLLSASTDGRPIPIAATVSPGTLIHTAHATAIDEIYLFAANWSGTDIEVIVEFGGTADPGDKHKTILPAGAGLVTIGIGGPLTNSLLVRAYASTGIWNVVDWVNRITP